MRCEMPSDPPVAISYSGGGQSLALVELVLRGVVPGPEHACVVFADTGAEHRWTYREVDATEKRCREAGIDFLRCSKGNLADNMLEASAKKRSDTPPFWVKDGGRIIQKCTREYKIRPMRRAIREWMRRRGLRLGQGCERWIGFALDEAHRAQRTIQAKNPAWERFRFPLIERRMTRSGVTAFLGREVPFSMCTFCPHKTYARHRAADPVDFAQAVAVDAAIRDLSECGLDGELYVSEQRVALPLIQDVTEAGGVECSHGACFL